MNKAFDQALVNVRKRRLSGRSFPDILKGPIPIKLLPGRLP
jgi:hypothetical protein